MQEIVTNGQTGLHFNPGDPDDLASKIAWAWEHPDELREMGLNARREYELKVLYQGHLVRSIKFSVDGEGKLVDNGIATLNQLGNSRIIVPVQVLGDSDGVWDRTAWKTGAFFGNPLNGFTAP